MKRLGKAVGQQLSTAKVGFLETIGRRETTETEEMQNATKKAEDVRVHLKDIYKKMNKASKGLQMNAEDSRLVVNSFRDYSNKMATNGDKPKLASVCRKVAEFEDILIQLKLQLDYGLSFKISESLKDFVKGDIREARYDKKSFDKIRQTYEGTLDRYKSMQKSAKANPKTLQDLQEECEQQKQLCEFTEYETLNKLKEVDELNDFISMDKCLEYFENYYKFFENGLARLNEVMPRVVIAKQREEIEKAKIENEKKRLLRQETIDHKEGRIKPRIFGAPLEEVAKKENRTVPLVVSKSIEYLSSSSVLDTEGLFRVSAAKFEIDALKKQYEEGKVPDLTKVEEPHIVTGLLKTYMRECPEPLLTFNLCEQFFAADSIENGTEKLNTVKNLIGQLPQVNRDTLAELFKLLTKIVEHQEKNKMTSNNLATVWGPNILYRKESTPGNMKFELEHSNNLTRLLIENYSFFFSDNPKNKGGGWKTVKPTDNK